MPRSSSSLSGAASCSSGHARFDAIRRRRWTRSAPPRVLLAMLASVALASASAGCGDGERPPAAELGHSRPGLPAVSVGAGGGGGATERPPTGEPSGEGERGSPGPGAADADGEPGGPTTPERGAADGSDLGKRHVPGMGSGYAAGVGTGRSTGGGISGATGAGATGFGGGTGNFPVTPPEGFSGVGGTLIGTGQESSGIPGAAGLGASGMGGSGYDVGGTSSANREAPSRNGGPSGPSERIVIEIE
jgi:hypothetical protein